MNPFKKINISNIELSADKGYHLYFKLAIEDEKQLNAAAGRIHRKAVEQDWSLEGKNVLVLRMSSNIRCPLGEICSMFEKMVS